MAVPLAAGSARALAAGSARPLAVGFAGSAAGPGGPASRADSRSRSRFRFRRGRTPGPVGTPAVRGNGLGRKPVRQGPPALFPRPAAVRRWGQVVGTAGELLEADS